MYTLTRVLLLLPPITPTSHCCYMYYLYLLSPLPPITPTSHCCYMYYLYLLSPLPPITPTSHCCYMYYLYLLFLPFPSRPLSQCPHFFYLPLVLSLSTPCSSPYFISLAPQSQISYQRLWNRGCHRTNVKQISFRQQRLCYKSWMWMKAATRLVYPR